MGLLDWIVGCSKKDFCNIINKHRNVMKERNLDEMHFMYGNKSGFIKRLERLKMGYLDDSQGSDSPGWAGHGAPAFIDDAIGHIQNNRAIDWDDFIFIFIDCGCGEIC